MIHSFTQSISTEHFMCPTLCPIFQRRGRQSSDLSLSTAVGTSPSPSPALRYCQTPTEAPPVQLPQDGLLACYQKLWAPRRCLILSIVRELESDMSDHFLWIWLTWVTSGHPGTLPGLILNTALEVKDSSPDMATQDLWCSSYQAASLASQRSHTFSLQHPLHHVSLST